MGLRVGRVVLFVGLAVVFGAVVPFLSAETAGILTLLLVPVWIRLRRRPRTLAQFLVPFGCGYLAASGSLVFVDSASFSGPGTGAYAAIMLAIGAAIILVGLVLLGRSRGAGAKGALTSRQEVGTPMTGRRNAAGGGQWT